MYAPDGTVIAPGQFIPVAEQHDLMPQLDRWVIRNAFQALGALKDDDELVYSINLSSKTVNETDLTDFVLEQAKASAVLPQRICFELTETSAVVDAGHTSWFLSTMRDYGFRIAIDDFGSGAASFSYLKKFPADILKVDRSLVVDAQGDKTSATLLEGLNNLALTLGIATVAEGLETASMVCMIQSMGFTYGQGFFLGRPAPFLRKDGSIARYVNQADETHDEPVAIGI
jgi:EAL domain-containing protein (putative c-di-GMP-specific phosphodiesterase class I)